MNVAKYAFELSFFESLHKRMPRDVRVVSILAQLYTQIGQIENGLKMDRKLVRLDPQDATAHYNLGCSLALKERKGDAVKAIQNAIDLGYRDFKWMRQDPDLTQLRDYPPFKALLEQLEIG
jgi:Flp pilus assembly protein TadD